MSRIVRAPSTPLRDSDATGHIVPWPPWRVWAIRGWYGLLSMWAVLMASSVVRMILGQAGPGEHFGFATISAWKLLATGGVLVICWTGGRSVVAYQALVVGVLAQMLSDRLWAVEPVDSTPVMSALAMIVLWLLPLVALRPNRRDLFRLRPQFSVVLLPMAVAAAVPLICYSIHQGALATGGGGVLVDPAYALTALGVVLAAQAVFAALRPSGTTWLPRFVALAAIWIGTAAIIWPDDLGSLGLAWGAVLAGWGCVFAAAAEAQRRARSSAPAEQTTATPKPVPEASTPNAGQRDGHQ